MTKMPAWEEWNGLNEGQQSYSLYKILVSLHTAQEKIDSFIQKYNEANEVRFKALENRKWFDRAAAGIGGIIGGILATLGIKAGN